MRQLLVTGGTSVRHWIRRIEGQDLLEYGLLASLIAAFVVGAATLAGDKINKVLWEPIVQGF